MNLRCEKLSMQIGEVCVVKNLDFELEPGNFWGLLGPNGSGKTTLLKGLAGLRKPDQGQILLGSDPIDQIPRRAVARQVGMLQQHTAYVFDSNVLQTVLTGRHPHLGYWQRESADDIEKAFTALHAVDLDGFTDRSVTGLSGGEARRLAFASLLVQEARIMLLDEPSNHLDLRHQVQIMGMVKQHSLQPGNAALAALHDINLAARYCSHILMLFGEGSWEAGPLEEMLSEDRLQRLFDCPIKKLQGEDGPCFYPLTP